MRGKFGSVRMYSCWRRHTPRCQPLARCIAFDWLTRADQLRAVLARPQSLRRFPKGALKLIQTTYHTLTCSREIAETRADGEYPRLKRRRRPIKPTHIWRCQPWNDGQMLLIGRIKEHTTSTALLGECSFLIPETVDAEELLSS